MKKKKLIFVGLIFVSLLANGQGINTINQVHSNLALLNPGHFGLEENKSIFVNYRKQWTGISNSPEQLSLLAQGNFLNKKIGLGLLLDNNSVGVLNRTHFGLAYNYKLKFKEAHFFQLGLQVGAERTAIDFSRIQANDPNEILFFQNNQSNTLAKFGFGVHYHLKKMNLGIAVYAPSGKSLSFANPITQTALSFQKSPYYTFYGQYLVKLGTFWTYTPTFSFVSSQGLDVNFDNSHLFSYKNKLDFALGYKQTQNLYGNFGITFLEQIKLTYSYQRNISSLGNLLKNSHELGLKFYILHNASKSSLPNEGVKKGKTEILQEEIDRNELKIRKLESELDSMQLFMEEQRKINQSLKESQLTKEEIQNLLQEKGADEKNTVKPASNTESEVIKVSSYQMVNANSSEEINNLKNETDAFYSIVLGVYKPYETAKALRVRLKREIDLDSRLQSIEIGGKILILVVLPENYTDVTKAHSDLVKFRKENQKKYNPYLNGEPWLLKLKK